MESSKHIIHSIPNKAQPEPITFPLSAHGGPIGALGLGLNVSSLQKCACHHGQDHTGTPILHSRTPVCPQTTSLWLHNDRDRERGGQRQKERGGEIVDLATFTIVFHVNKAFSEVRKRDEVHDKTVSECVIMYSCVQVWWLWHTLNLTGSHPCFSILPPILPSFHPTSLSPLLSPSLTPSLYTSLPSSLSSVHPSSPPPPHPPPHSAPT